MTKKILFSSLLIASLLLPGCQVQPVTAPATLTPAGLVSTPSNTPETSPEAATPQPTETPGPTPLPQANTEDLKGLVVEFWHPWTGETGKVVEELVREYNRTNPWAISISEHAQGSSGELFSRLKNRPTGEQSPQAVAAPMDQILSWQDSPTLAVDLNPYMHDPEWGLTEKEIKDVADVFWKQYQNENKQLGLPAQGTAVVLFYNESWAKELGFEHSPENPDEFLSQACAAAQANMRDTTKDNDGSGGWIINVDPLSTLSWLVAFGGGKIPDTGDATYQFNTPENLEALQFLRKLSDQGCAWSARNSQPYEYFGQRMALFYSGTLQDLPYQTRTMQRLNNSDQWNVIPFPAKSGSGAALTGGLSYSILQSSPAEQLAAWLFIRWMAQPQNQARLAQASVTLPVTSSATASLDTLKQSNLQWARTVEWIPNLQPTPRLASWRTVRNVLEDATWQAFQPTIKADQLEQVLIELDQTVTDLITKD